MSGWAFGNRVSIRTIVIYLLGFIVLEIAIALIMDLPDLYVLNERGVQTNATLVRYDVQNNDGEIEYEFDGKAYRYGYFYRIGSNKTYPKVGYKFAVTIDPELPARYSFGDASNEYNSNIRMMGISAIALLVFGVVGLFFKRVDITVF